MRNQLRPFCAVIDFNSGRPLENPRGTRTRGLGGRFATRFERRCPSIVFETQQSRWSPIPCAQWVAAPRLRQSGLPGRLAFCDPRRTGRVTGERSGVCAPPLRLSSAAQYCQVTVVWPPSGFTKRNCVGVPGGTAALRALPPLILMDVVDLYFTLVQSDPLM